MAEHWVIEKLKNSIVTFREERVEAGLTDQVETDKVIRTLLLETPLSSNLGIRHPCMEVRLTGCTEKEIDQAFAELAQEAKSAEKKDDEGMSTRAKLLFAGLAIGGTFLLIHRKRKSLTGLRADRLQLPTTGHIERMTRESDRFKVIKKKLSEDLRDSLCVQAHRRMRDLMKLGGRIESHAQSVGLPEEMTPFLEKLRADLQTAAEQFDQGCQVSRRGRGRVPKARRAVRTWI